MEVYKLSDKEFRIIFLKKFGELQEHTDRQLKRTRKTSMNKMTSSTKK